MFVLWVPAFRVYLRPAPGLLEARLVPVTFDVPLDVVTSPVSLDSATLPSKLIS